MQIVLVVVLLSAKESKSACMADIHVWKRGMDMLNSKRRVSDSYQRRLLAVLDFACFLLLTSSSSLPESSPKLSNESNKSSQPSSHPQFILIRMCGLHGERVSITRVT